MQTADSPKTCFLEAVQPGRVGEATIANIPREEIEHANDQRHRKISCFVVPLSTEHKVKKDAYINEKHKIKTPYKKQSLTYLRNQFSLGTYISA